MKAGGGTLSFRSITFIRQQGTYFNEKYTITPPSGAPSGAMAAAGIAEFLLNGIRRLYRKNIDLAVFYTYYNIKLRIVSLISIN